MKNIIATGIISIISFIANFIAFTVNYNRLATPHLHEAQRAENADTIMTVTLGSFSVIAVLTGLAIYLCFGKNKS